MRLPAKIGLCCPSPRTFPQEVLPMRTVHRWDKAAQRPTRRELPKSLALGGIRTRGTLGGALPLRLRPHCGAVRRNQQRLQPKPRCATRLAQTAVQPPFFGPVGRGQQHLGGCAAAPVGTLARQFHPREAYVVRCGIGAAVVAPARTNVRSV
jgi:hypothetical protein